MDNAPFGLAGALERVLLSNMTTSVKILIDVLDARHRDYVAAKHRVRIPRSLSPGVFLLLCFLVCVLGFGPVPKCPFPSPKP
jgi:hypothetical protein